MKQLLLLIETKNQKSNITTNFSPLISKENEGTRVASLILQTRSATGKILRSLDKQEYFVKNYQNRLSFITKKPIESITLKVDLESDRVLGLSANIDYPRSDRSSLQKGIEFLDSFNKAKTLSVEDVDNGTSNNYAILDKFKFDTDRIKELVDAIIVIENYTGLRFNIPQEEMPYIEFLKIKNISQIINTKLALHRPLLLITEREEALKLIKKYMDDEINKRSILSTAFKADILDHSFVIEDVMLNLAAVKPAMPLDELYRSISAQNQNMASVKLVSAMDPMEDIVLHVESQKSPQAQAHDDKVETGFDIPIPQKLSYLYEDLVNNLGESILYVFSKVQQDLEGHQAPKKIIKKLEQLRLLFELVKYTYDDNTLNYEIDSDMEKQLSILIDQIREGNHNEAQLLADDIMGIFQTLTDSKKLLRDEGVNVFTMKDTGKRIGEMRIFKAMRG